MRLIHARHVSLALGNQQLFFDVDLAVDPGMAIWLKGPNGSGKTTFLRALRGQQAVDEGRIELAGRGVENWHPCEREVLAPMVDQDPVLDWRVLAVDNLVDRLALGDRTWRWFFTFRRAVRGRLLQEHGPVIDKLGLAEAMLRPTEEMSLGQRRLLTLARALRPRQGEEPRVLLLDEPLAGLPSTRAKAVLDLLEERIRAGWAVVVAEHLEEIQQLNPVVLEFPAIHGRSAVNA